MTRILQRLCPHWWTEDPHGVHQPIMFKVDSWQKCMICGKRRVYARVPEPHPTRDKEDLIEDLQQPGCEFVIKEWLPYGSMGPANGGPE